MGSTHRWSEVEVDILGVQREAQERHIILPADRSRER